MKLRLGFVSNSSSSSFIATGIVVDWDIGMNLQGEHDKYYFLDDLVFFNIEYFLFGTFLGDNMFAPTSIKLDNFFKKIKTIKKDLDKISKNEELGKLKIVANDDIILGFKIFDFSKIEIIQEKYNQYTIISGDRENKYKIFGMVLSDDKQREAIAITINDEFIKYLKNVQKELEQIGKIEDFGDLYLLTRDT